MRRSATTAATGDRRRVANTCGNRPCPLCQGAARARWVADRDAELLPVTYAHVVLTVPAELRSLLAAFPRLGYGVLMRAAASAVAWLAAQEKHLGAEVGIISILHTWKRNLGLHPHVHLLVTAGGWQAEAGRWVDAPLARRRGARGFFLPVAALRAAFQRRLRRLLLRAFAAGDFHRDETLAGMFPWRRVDGGAHPRLTPAPPLPQRRHPSSPRQSHVRSCRPATRASTAVTAPIGADPAGIDRRGPSGSASYG